MKLQIFNSAEGDCLLLQSRDGNNILCDGGRASSMRNHVREQLTELVGHDGGLDYIYVSHVDQDHIHGVQQLLEDTLAWKVFDHHEAKSDSEVKSPRFARPPVIGGIWHNSFGAQVEDNQGEIADLLAQSAQVLFATGVPDLEHIAYESNNIASSIPQALKVSYLCKPEMLDIPLNLLPGGGEESALLYNTDEPQQFEVGSLRMTLIGPTEQALADLRKGWNSWLETNKGKKDIKKFRSYIRKQLDQFSTGQLTTTPFDLSSWNGMPSFKGVTTPNVASLMFMVEEEGKRLLLTGDSQQDVILEALETTGYLQEGYLHVDILKVPHHGSEHNMDTNFARRVSADHYVFCGDGSHGNPEPEVIDIIAKSRIGAQSRLALSPDAKYKPFTFWFSSSLENLPTSSKRYINFKQMRKRLLKRQSESGGLMSIEFVDQDYRTITL